MLLALMKKVGCISSPVCHFHCCHCCCCCPSSSRWQCKYCHFSSCVPIEMHLNLFDNIHAVLAVHRTNAKPLVPQALYMFLALAITCDEYFVTSLEKICEVRGSVFTHFIFFISMPLTEPSDSSSSSLFLVLFFVFSLDRNWTWARTWREPPSWQLAALRRSSLHPSLVCTHSHTHTHVQLALRCSQMVTATADSWLAPLAAKVSSSPTVTWGWGPSLAQRSSTSFASSACAGSSLDRCVCAIAAASFC